MSYQQPVRRRSKAPRRILITVLVLVVLLVAADRVGDLVAENYAADKLQSSQQLPAKPDVSIGGFPFLTQFASGEYDDVELTTKDYPVGGKFELDTVDIALDHLTVTDNFRSYHVDRASAVATTSYETLSRAIGVDVSWAGNGRIKASKQISILGYTLNPTVTVKPEVSGGALRFVGDAANGLGAIGGELSRAVDAVFGTGLPLDGLPFQIKVTDLTATEQGLRLDLAASDLSYNG